MIELRDNPEGRRWEALLDGEVVGYSEYRRTSSRIIFTHTVVDPDFEGRGIASRLAQTAVDDAIEHGLRITPYCPFVRAYLERHREYAESVDMPTPRSSAG